MEKNQLYFGDCLEILEKYLIPNHPEGFIDLVYIDPPFNSKKNYNVLFESIDMRDTKAQKKAFEDTWSNISYMDELDRIQELNLELYDFLKTLERVKTPHHSVAYLTTMALRIIHIHKVLKDSGSFYLHCDPNMSHYLKLVCDMVFGHRNYKNEIIWHYRRWTGGAKAYMKMHDVILFYAKDKNKMVFNPQYTAYTEKSLARKQYYHTRIKGDDVFETEIDPNGVRDNDVWQIPLLNSQAKERLGYPTQKPQELLEKIIQTSTNPGDIVADFFCGCGTTIAASEKLKRKWIGVDISHLAIRLIIDRITRPWEMSEPKQSEIKNTIEVTGIPRDVDGAKELAQNTKRGRFTFQDWVIEFLIGGVTNPKKSGDGGYDGYITFRGLSGEKEVILIEVKSGNVGVKNIREFIQVVEKQKAKMGVFVCFKEQIGAGMLTEARQTGFYQKAELGDKYQKIRIVSVEELLDGYKILYPEILAATTFKASKDTLIKPIKHGRLFE